MVVQVFFSRSVILFAGLLFMTTGTLAIGDDSESSQCFDFSTSINQPLYAPFAKKDLTLPEPYSKSGKLKENLYWAAVGAEIKKPIGELLRLFEDHNLTKSSRVSKMEVKTIQDSRYLARHQVRFEVDPFPLVSVNWTEDWGYSLIAGTPSALKEILISYQKSKGTSHIRHLCGNMLLKAVSPESTRVYLYEEAEATGRTQQDTLSGLQGTLHTIAAEGPKH